MGAGTTLGDLKTLALDLAEMTATASSFIVDGRLDQYANAALGYLHDLIVRADKNYLKKEVDFTVISGQESYQLPNDFYKPLGIYYLSGNDRIPIPSFNPRATAGYKAPTTSATVRMWYVPQFAKLKTDNQEIHPIIPSGWEIYPALCMAEFCLLRAKLDPSHVRIRRDEEATRIIEMLEPRDTADTSAVEDVEARFGPPYPVNVRGLTYALVGNKLTLMQEWPPSR